MFSSHLDFRASFCDLSAVLAFISDSVIIFIVIIVLLLYYCNYCYIVLLLFIVLFPWFSLVEKSSEMKNKLQKALKTKCL